MFERLFTCPGALRRHREGPLAAERAAYLNELEERGMAYGTIVHRSFYCLCIAIALQRSPPDQSFSEDEVELLADEWASQRVGAGRASSPRWPKAHFRFAATDFLQHLGRFRPSRAAEVGRYGAELDDFIAAQQEGQWTSESTCHSARWQISRFLDYLEQRNISLAAVAATDIDAFFEHMAQRWSRSSLQSSAKMLRAWFGYCERRGWARAGLAGAILSPRIYHQEGLPLGPTWDVVSGHTDSSLMSFLASL